MKLFTASWCGNCQPVKKYIEENSLEVELVDVDTDEGMLLAQKVGVKGIPAFLSGDNLIVSPNKILEFLKND